MIDAIVARIAPDVNLRMARNRHPGLAQEFRKICKVDVCPSWCYYGDMPAPNLIPRREYGLIRRLSRKNGWSLARISRKYGVSRQRIWTIVHETAGAK